ncbi:MAG TPA: PKD domain-containing protein, partial [Chitinophagales bacterium]|nr:PKD domain-containing protein [Chitinophagales bacterium]
GDGDTAQELFTSHTYTQSGTYTACFHYDNGSCTIDSCRTLVIDICDFGPYINSTTNHLDATLSVPGMPGGATYSWVADLGGGPVLTSTNASPVFTFPAYGWYWVRVEVTLPNSCMDTALQYIQVKNPCAAGFYYSTPGTTTPQFFPSPFDSSNLSTFTYAWTFGDGGSSSDYVPTHDFGSFGKYNVCVTVSDGQCSDTYCDSVVVAPPPVPTYSIFGKVHKGSINACASTVYLIREETPGFLSLVDTYNTIDSGGIGCLGDYYFRADEGVYYVKAALLPTDVDYASYLPTYYGNELNWANATPVSLYTDQYNIDINLTAGVNPGGPGFVGGWVSQGAGLAIGNNNESRSEGDPLPGIQINLLTVNDVPVASTYTDAMGRYTFSNLALGTYKVYAEEINKVPYPLNVTLTANNPSQDNVNVSVNSNSAVTGVDNLRDIYIDGILPNPVLDKAIVSVSLNEAAAMLLTLTDLTGRRLQSRSLNLHTGTNQVIVDLSNEPSGVYHLALTNGADKKILKLVKAKP